MKAQPARVQGIPDPVTPVIIKTGGGGPDDDTPPLSIPVKIESLFMPFAETVNGLTWESSESTARGRISTLLIKDGTDLKDLKTIFVPVSDQPASVTIHFGEEQLIIMESGNPAQNDMRLMLVSPEVPFHVPQSGDWTESDSFFRSQVTRVILMVGEEVKYHHTFLKADVAIKVDFNLS